MKKAFFLLACFLSACVLSQARSLPFYKSLSKPKFHPIVYSESHKAVSFYLPIACSGFLNEYIAGRGTLSIAVKNRRYKKKPVVQVSLHYNGEAQSTLGYAAYEVDGKTSLLVAQPINVPTDVFIKDLFKLSAKNKSADLYLGDLGFITLYPDGRMVSHVLDTENVDPGYSHPAIYCNCSGSKE